MLDQFGDTDLARQEATLVWLGLAWGDLLIPDRGVNLPETLAKIFADEGARTFLRINKYEGTLWLDQERCEQMVALLCLTGYLESRPAVAAKDPEVESILATGARILAAAAEAGYRIDKMLSWLDHHPSEAS